jgi:Deacetylase PdaC
VIGMLRTCLTIHLLAVSLQALAADPKPDFAIATKALEASVFLDATIKADPALAANSLAEGKAWAEKNRADADKERKSEPELFRNGPWTRERKYETRSVVDDRYVSIIRNDYEYTGGAHPNSSSDTILWDRSAGKRISIRPFFTETADNGPTLKAMRLGVIASLKAEKNERGVEDTDAGAIEAIEPKLLKIGPVSLAPSTEQGKSSGLTFHYSPYAVGSYAEGGYVAFVPWETLKRYLTPEGARIFGGARPKGDEAAPQ